MWRSAICHCSQLQVKCKDDPLAVVMCHCELCQRRTGSTYNLGAFFNSSNVKIEGKSKTYCRTGEEGVKCIFHLCPICGTSIYWEVPEVIIDLVGVAVGCFADPDFPKPTVSFYGKSRHHWVTQPDIPSYITNRRKGLEENCSHIWKLPEGWEVNKY